MIVFGVLAYLFVGEMHLQRVLTGCHAFRNIGSCA